MEPNLYSPDQVAERLGLHVRTIRNYVRNGQLRATRIGKQYRIAPKEIAKLTGQPLSAFEGQQFRSAPRSEVSSIVDIDGISSEMATRITTLLMGAANGRGKRNPELRAQTIYDQERKHMKIILVGAMEDNAACFSLINEVLKSWS